MCTVKELIAQLQTLPENTVVNVIEADNAGGFEWVELNLNSHSDTFDFCDLKDNPFCTNAERKTTPRLDLGST